MCFFFWSYRIISQASHNFRPLYISPKQILGHNIKQVVSLTARLYNLYTARDQRGKWWTGLPFSSSRVFFNSVTTSYVTLTKFFNLFSNSPCAILGLIIPYVRVECKLIARGFYAQTSKQYALSKKITFLLKQQLLYWLQKNLVYISNFPVYQSSWSDTSILCTFSVCLHSRNFIPPIFDTFTHVLISYRLLFLVTSTEKIRPSMLWGGKMGRKVWSNNPCTHTKRISLGWMNEGWNERHMNTKRRLSKTVLATGLFMSRIWYLQAIKSKAGISRISFTPLTHPLPFCSHKTSPECATGNQAKTIQEKHILILATQLPLGSLNTLPSKCFHTPSYPRALDRLSLIGKLIPQLISVWHCYSNQPKLVQCPTGANWVLIQVPSTSLCYVAWSDKPQSLYPLGRTDFQSGLKNNPFSPYPVSLHINTESKHPKISFEVVPESDTVPQYDVMGGLLSLCQNACSLAVWKTIWGI